MFEIDFEETGGVILRGRLDASRAEVAQEAFDQVHGVVPVDCTELEYISSAGLGVLLKTQKRLLGENGKLRLSGLNSHLQDIFRYSGFDQIFEIVPDD